MPGPTVVRRLLLPLAAGTILLVIGLQQIEMLDSDRTLLKPYDFVQYWSAGYLLLHGGDPYDSDQLFPLQRSMYDLPKTVMMWNPPWALPLTLPFAAMPWRLAQFLWLGMQLAAVLLSVDMLWRYFGGDLRHRWVAWLVAMTFAPTLFLLLMGQISGLLLLGSSGFLVFMRRDRPAIAGCFAALTAIKPHLSALFAIVLLLEAIHQRSARKAVAVGALLLFVFAALALVWDRHVWSQYFAAMARPPSADFVTMRQFEHPTVGYWLRLQVPDQPFWAQFVPFFIAAPSTAFYWVMRRRSFDWSQAMPWLVPLSLFTAVYGAWAFDLVLLLLPLVQVAVWLACSKSNSLIALVASVYLILNVLCLLTIRQVASQANPWITPLVLAAYGIAVFVRAGPKKA